MTTTDSMAYALFRLQRNVPELHAKVVAGEMSVHAAMVQAGFRPPRFTIMGTKPATVAKALRNNLPDDVLAEVARLIAC